jgi:hypothetical protein
MKAPHRDKLLLGSLGALVVYSLTYAELRFSHVLVHRWYEILNPKAQSGTHGVDYWIVEDIGHGSFFNRATWKPRNDSADAFLRAGFFPLVEAESLMWTSRARLQNTGKIWFYDSAQRAALKRVLSGDPRSLK